MSSRPPRDLISDRLREIIKLKDLTMAELANISGVPVSNISNVLRKKSDNKMILDKISSALNINPDYLTNKECKKHEVEIDINLFSSCSSIAIQAIKRAHIKAQPSLINFLQNELYRAVLELKLPVDQGEAFILGLITYGMKIGTITRSSLSSS